MAKPPAFFVGFSDRHLRSLQARGSRRRVSDQCGLHQAGAWETIRVFNQRQVGHRGFQGINPWLARLEPYSLELLIMLVGHPSGFPVKNQFEYAAALLSTPMEKSCTSWDGYWCSILFIHSIYSSWFGLVVWRVSKIKTSAQTSKRGSFI